MPTLAYNRCNDEEFNNINKYVYLQRVLASFTGSDINNITRYNNHVRWTDGNHRREKTTVHPPHTLYICILCVCVYPARLESLVFNYVCV